MPFNERPGAREILESSSLLNAISSDDMEQLGQVSRPAFAERGEVIWLCGAEVDFFSVVHTGFVKMSRPTPSGLDMTTELIGPGQVFGMLGVIEGKGCPSTATAVTDTWYARIPKRVFLPIYQRSPLLKEKLIRRLTNRFHNTHELMSKMLSGKVESRIAAILFLLAESYATRTLEGIRLDVPLTRQEISELAGTTVETTIRVLSRWQKEGVVSTEHQVITILKEHVLSETLAA